MGKLSLRWWGGSSEGGFQGAVRDVAEKCRQVQAVDLCARVVSEEMETGAQDRQVLPGRVGSTVPLPWMHNPVLRELIETRQNPRLPSSLLQPQRGSDSVRWDETLDVTLGSFTWRRKNRTQTGLSKNEN